MSTDNLPALRHSVADVRDMARAVAQSRLFGMDEAQITTLMLLAQSEGIHPVQAMKRFHVIHGRPAMKADAMLADFMARGGAVDWHRHDPTGCEATFHAPGLKTPVKVSWTMEDAKKAELLKNSMWSKYPRQMLRSRVISEGIRMAMPGIVAGIYTPEEVVDFEPARVEARVAEVETIRDAQAPEAIPAPANQFPDRIEQGETWSKWIGPELRRVNSEWMREMVAEGIEPDQRQNYARLADESLMVDHVCTRLVALGQIAEADVASGRKPGVRDPRKARAVIEDLFAHRPRGIKATVARHLDEKRSKARAELGMPDDDQYEDADRAAAAIVDAAPREPGCDDE